MAALRKIAGKISTITSYHLLPPPLFISRRAIATKLFVGGLSFYTTENVLSEAFSQYGQIVEAKIITDRVSNRSKGFAFVTFASEDEAHAVQTEMNGKTINGRAIFVAYAKPKPNSGGGMPIARGPPEPSKLNYEDIGARGLHQPSELNHEDIRS